MDNPQPLPSDETSQANAPGSTPTPQSGWWIKWSHFPFCADASPRVMMALFAAIGTVVALLHACDTNR